MWWIVGGVLILAAVRWAAGRNLADAPLAQADQVERAYQTLRRGRPVAIGEAPDGPVLFKGKVSALGAALATPLAQRSCVFWDLRVDDLHNLGRDPLSKSPPTGSTATFHDRRSRSFLITDETGTAEVRVDDVADASFVVEPHLCLQGRRLRASTEVTSALGKLGIAWGGPIVVSEAAIFVGDTVSVTGVGMREATVDGESAGYRHPPIRFVVRGGSNSQLAILKNKGESSRR